MVPRVLAAAQAMRSRTCADVIQPCCTHIGRALVPSFLGPRMERLGP